MQKEIIDNTYVKIQDVPKALKKYGINISYRGLRHYINLGILPKPRKFKGHKEKYYIPYLTAMTLLGIRYACALFNLNHNKIKEIASKIILSDWLMMELATEFLVAYGKHAKEKSPKFKEAFPFTKGEFKFVNPGTLNDAATLYIQIFFEELKKRGSIKDPSQVWQIVSDCRKRFDLKFSKKLKQDHAWFKQIYTKEKIKETGEFINRRTGKGR